MAEPVSPFRRLVAATDFSPPSLVAFDRAVELAAAHGASLQVLHVSDPDLAALEPAVHRREVAAEFEKLAARADASGVAIETHDTVGGASAVISEHIETTAPDLTVIGTRGWTPWDRITLGSVADRVVRRVEHAVLLVHPTDTGGLADIGRVAVGMDFSEAAVAAVDLAAQLLEPRRARVAAGTAEAGSPPVLELAHADLLSSDPMMRLPRREQEAQDRAEVARARLERLGESWRSSSLRVETVVGDRSAADLMCQVAAERAADVVVMGTQGRRGLERLLLGSVAERVMAHAPCPVAVVHA